MKDIIAYKNKLAKFETVALTEAYTSKILNRSQLPTKLKDPGSFTVQVTIRNSLNARGLYDLGAYFNLMPSSIFFKLGLGNP